MARYTDILLQFPVGFYTFHGAGSNYMVQTNSGVLYSIFIDNDQDPCFKKSVNNGITWTLVTALKNCSATQISVWYDRWCGINGDLIHVAYTNDVDDDVYYRNINAASSDTLSAETKIHAGSSWAAGGTISIVRTRGGNIICAGCIDAGAEPFCYKSTDVGANWSSINSPMESATQDQIILMPGWASDNQDAMAFFIDASANGLSRKLYDDSGNSWGESEIVADGSFADVVATTTYPHFAASVDITNSANILIAWNAIDTLNADLLCWSVTESSITAKSNIITNSTDDQGFAAFAIDTGTQYWYAFYAGVSGGTETIGTSTNIYYKVSQDSGNTWGAETLLNNTNYPNNVIYLNCTPRFANSFCVSWIHGGPIQYELRCSAFIQQPRATFQLGM